MYVQKREGYVHTHTHAYKKVCYQLYLRGLHDTFIVQLSPMCSKGHLGFFDFPPVCIHLNNFRCLGP